MSIVCRNRRNRRIPFHVGKSKFSVETLTETFIVFYRVNGYSGKRIIVSQRRESRIKMYVVRTKSSLTTPRRNLSSMIRTTYPSASNRYTPFNIFFSCISCLHFVPLLLLRFSIFSNRSFHLFAIGHVLIRKPKRGGGGTKKKKRKRKKGRELDSMPRPSPSDLSRSSLRVGPDCFVSRHAENFSRRKSSVSCRAYVPRQCTNFCN